MNAILVCFVMLCSYLPSYLQCQFDSALSWLDACANSFSFEDGAQSFGLLPLAYWLSCVVMI